MAEPEKRCPRCHEKVHLLANLCKHCGYEFNASEMASAWKQNETKRTIGAGCFLVFVIVLGLAFCRKSETPTTPKESAKANTSVTASDSASPSGYADEAKQYAWVSAGEEQIKSVLKDPASADFRNVHFYSGGGVPVACGEVNAKNGFGGFTGFERFIAAGSVMAVTESMVSGGLDPVWDKYCVKASTDRA